MLILPSHITSSGGLGFLGALTLLFVGLKLTGYIDWSWWWVLSPLFHRPDRILPATGKGQCPALSGLAG